MFIFNISSLSSSSVFDADLHIFKKRLRVGGGGKRKLPRDWDKRAKPLQQQRQQLPQEEEQQKRQQMQRRRGRNENNKKDNNNNSNSGANEVHEKSRRREGKERKRKEGNWKREEKEVVVMQLFEVAPTYMSAMDEVVLPIGKKWG